MKNENEILFPRIQDAYLLQHKITALIIKDTHISTITKIYTFELLHTDS